MRIIDLSVPTEECPSEALGMKMSYESHEAGVEFIKRFLGCDRNDLPGGLGPAGETATLISHAGTHVDAPWHYAPISEGKKARTIDELPLEWFLADGVLLDVRGKPDGSGITVDHIKECLAKISCTLKDLDIVLLQTGADRYWGKQEYFDRGCGLIRESTLWLLERGVKVIGTDAWGLDRPFRIIRDEFRRTGRKEILWEAHYAGIEKEYCQIEKLANLDKIPFPVGFKVSCFPVKLRGAGAAWCRAVAIVDL